MRTEVSQKVFQGHHAQNAFSRGKTPWPAEDMAETSKQRLVRELSQQLEAKNKELRAFNYSISHDLRQPVRIINNFLSRLRKDLQDKLDEEANRKFDVILSNTQKMNRLIDDILLFLKLGSTELTVCAIDWKKLLDRVWQELRDNYHERKIDMKISTLADCHADENMIKQVFVNLLANALKFTKDREAATIEIGSVEKTDECVYYVKDNGIGFDMQFADRLFLLFNRLHSDVEFEGTGKGLSFTKRIIERHGGRVWAEGKVNEGATFYFTIPKRDKIHHIKIKKPIGSG